MSKRLNTSKNPWSFPERPDFYLIPRLIARDAYRHPLPPDPWPDVLRADLRFVTGKEAATLAERLVNDLERPVFEKFLFSRFPFLSADLYYK